MQVPASPQRRLPKESRTIPLRGNKIRGDGQDHGKWFRCWYCGARCSVDRESLGGPDSKANITPEEYTQLDQYGNEVFHCYGAAGKDQTICEAAGGTWTSTRYKAAGSGGCWLCFSPNWRGDY